MKNFSNISNPNFLSRLSRQIGVKNYRTIKLLESEHLGYYEMNDTIPKKAMFLIPPLPLIEETKDKDEKPKATDVIEFLLKQRAGSSAKSPTYKLKVTRFCEGTVSEWIEFRKAIAELWRQNSITEVLDKIASITSILRGDSLTGFEEKVQELTTSTNDAGDIEVLEATDETVTESLNAVAHMVFPFRALETQKQWMRRRMRKPKELSIRKTVAAVGRLNNSLPLFPNGTESDKFTAGEILEILEWSIPELWRTKFDLDGYVPTEFNKERFMTECEAIERNMPKVSFKSNTSTTNGKTVTHKKSQGVKNRASTQKNDTTAKFFCTEHGQNPTHNTDKCYILKNRAEKTQRTSSSGLNLTKKTFRKEIHFLSKKRPKKQILEMFASVIQREQKHLIAKTPKKGKKTPKILIDNESSDSSDEDMSVDHIMITEPDKSKTDKPDTNMSDSPSDKITDETDEDKTYQFRIQNLGAINID